MSGANTAEAASHEIGHNLGLSHDGFVDGTNSRSYYSGHGHAGGDTSWSTIMGTGYGENVTQWSRGEYFGANNTQDDLEIISGRTGYREDDHGQFMSDATPLVFDGGTNIVSLDLNEDPDNAHPENKGIIMNTNDVDVFWFSVGETTYVELAVSPMVVTNQTRGNNLDIDLELVSEVGNLLSRSSPTNETGAEINAIVAPGTYFLYVSNSGMGNPENDPPDGYTPYGSCGHYFINGSLSDANNPDRDNDGLPDTWEFFYFGNLDQGPNDDPDQDGKNNLQEFLDGTDPLDFRSSFQSLTIAGTMNSWNQHLDNMALIGNFLWSGIVDIDGNEQFKFVANHSWDTKLGGSESE